MFLLDNPAIFSYKSLKIEPHKGQILYLLDNHPIKILLGGRRSGKTFCLTIEIVYYLLLAIKNKSPIRQIIVLPRWTRARFYSNRLANF